MKRQLGFAGERYIYLPLHIIDQVSHHALTQNLYIKFLGHFINAKFHYINRPKGCADYILIYCREGRGWVQIEKTKYIIESNTFIILPPNVPHSYGADDTDPWSIYWFHYGGTNAAYISRNNHVPYILTESNDSRLEERLEIFEEIYQALSIEQTIDYFCYANSQFIHFLSSLIYVDIYRQVKHFQTDTTLTDNHQLINRLTHYIDENIDRKITINDLSDFINLSPSYLHRIFVAHYGISPMKYLIRAKMNKACDMLLGTTLKINQIAARLSYPDSLYFSRLFRQTIGLSPKAFRDSH